ncbi:hypothetical protein N0V94_004216 [Neodidymelliopsis sp. IMI 364377]|nr:hypothetical protein N0V94_004216 [Neodidymelliopsis sp. IMI 364377]
MPPKRMSDILTSSSIDTRISQPAPTLPSTSSSDGPTLPIIGATTTEHSTRTTGPKHGTKRKRDASAPTTAPHAQQPNIRTNHPSLYEPWVLLPSRAQKEVEKRGNASVDVLVFSKNQNIKSGISKLRGHLCIDSVGNGAQETTQIERKHNEKIIAVSAQGDGTVKLVGIVDMVRRIVGEGGEKGRDGKAWYMYTALSSVEMPRRPGKEHHKNDNKEDEDEEGDAMEVDVDDDADAAAASSTRQTGANEDPKPKTKTHPVLTVWISSTRLPAFRDVFGEQSFSVYGDSAS